MAHPKFIIKKAKNDQYYFVLTARNGEPVAKSEYYKAKASCVSGIESVKKNSQIAEIDDQSDAVMAA